MKKNRLILSLYLFACWGGVYGGGGVDVGNGSKIIPYYTSDFLVESDLLNAIGNIKQNIEDMLDTRVLQSQRNAHCEEIVQVLNIEKIKKYNIKGNELGASKIYKGRIYLYFKKCTKPHLLPKEIGNHY